MRLLRIAASTSIALALALAPLYAAPKGPKAPSSIKASASKTPKAPKTTTLAKPAKAPKAMTAKAPKATTAKAPKLAKASTTTTATTTTASTTTSTPVTSPSTSTTIDYTKGKVAEKLAKNTNLRTKLESQLQAAGYDGTVYQAAYGFKNQGQFIAATNASQNRGVPFEQLKLQMTGLSVDADGVLWKANLGADGTITLVAPADVTNPAPMKSLGQAKKTVLADAEMPAPTTAGPQ